MAWAVFDAELRFVGVNAALAEINGVAAEAHVGRTLLEVLPEQNPEVVEQLRRVRDTGRPEEVRVAGYTPRFPGQLRHWNVSYYPVREGAAIVGVGATVVDVTAAAEADAARQASEAKSRALADALPGLVFVHDSSGRNSFVNKAFCDFAGRPREGLLEDAWLDLIHPADLEEAGPAWQKAVAARSPFDCEYRFRRHDGVWRWFLVRSVPHVDASGAVVEWIGTAADISERKAFEQSLQDADRRKDEFIAILAHELRNPLAPVRNAVEILRRLGPPEPRIARAREIIDRQVSHMSRLIDDLLDVSRISRGKLALAQELCDLAAIARQTAEDYRPSLEAVGVELAIHAPEESIWVTGDPVRLAQMLGNLLNNAQRFTDRGGRVDVRIEADVAQAQARLSVVDTGLGIDRDLLSRLFDPFSQGEQDLARTKGGLGLGLALTRGLAELHGGSIVASSEGPGRGATFTLLLPLRQGALQRQATSPPSAQAEPLDILIVEDNIDAAETLGQWLALLGHEVRVTHDAKAALAETDARRPEVVISDLGLPGELDGYALATRLRASGDGRPLFLIAMSGYAGIDVTERCRRAGFDVHLGKPCDIPDLERALRDAAAGRLSRAAS